MDVDPRVARVPMCVLVPQLAMANSSDRRRLRRARAGRDRDRYGRLGEDSRGLVRHRRAQR